MWWQTNSQRILYFTPKSFFFINNLNKLPLGVDFTAGGITSITNHPLRIYSDNFLQCMNVNNECFDICKAASTPRQQLATCCLLHFLVMLPVMTKKCCRQHVANCCLGVRPPLHTSVPKKEDESITPLFIGGF
jgi:hypothetical protein